MIDIHVAGERVRVEPTRVRNAGYSGRDREAVEAHIDELVDEGIERPAAVPTCYPVAPHTVLVDPGSIQVVGERTSGEAEFGLVFAGEETYVVAASDHTDRALEAHDIQQSKQIAPNVLSREAWRFGSIEAHWDRLELRSWTTVDGERRAYQEAILGDILRPTTLLEDLPVPEPPHRGGSVLLSGTVPTISGELVHGSRFAVELADPVLDRSLTVGYDVAVI